MSKDVLVSGMMDSGAFPSRAAAERAYDAVIESLTEALAADGEVALRPFGTFLVRERKARMGRDPRTGQPVAIPAHRTVVFRAGASLRQSAVSGPDWLDLKTYTRLLQAQVEDSKRFLERHQVPAKAGQYAREAAERLGRLTSEATARLKEYSEAKKPAWAELKAGLERAYGELKTAFHKARGKF